MSRITPLNLLRGEPIVLEKPDGEMAEGINAIVHQTDVSDQTVLDVQTKFINQARYKGDADTLTVTWPKSYPESLIGCHAWVRGNRYRIYGNPITLDERVCPTGYNRRVVMTRPLYLYTVDLLTETSTKDQWGVMHMEFAHRTVKANLLRLASESQASDVGQYRPFQDITLFELDPADYRDEHAYEFQGVHYHVTARAFAEDTVVLTGQGNVADG